MQPASKTLYAYWDEVRRGRLAPRRFEIEPGRIAEVLAESFILERADAGMYRFRLAGTRICEQFGIELRGVNFLDLWTADRVQIERMLADVSDRGAVAIVQFEATSESQTPASFELVLLPLVHTRHVIDRYLGAISCAGTAPQWLGYERASALKLVQAELIWPDGPPEARLAHQAPLRPSSARGRIVRADRRQFRVFDGGLSNDILKLR